MKLLCVLMTVVGLAGCQSYSTPSGNKQARADLEAKSHSHVSGFVTLRERHEKVLVSINVSGLAPNSVHGFHVHEKGDCSAADAASAGGHFNPDQHAHGDPRQQNRHAGAMVNLVADAKGEAVATFEVDTIRLDDGKYGILHRALIVHANPDDYVSQPLGNAGGRVACGVITQI
jgi:superoxide dismutase, Cu-Zn family